MCRGCKSTINIDAMAYQDIVAVFPNLMRDGFWPTRVSNEHFNCIAYAANDERRSWWPGQAHLEGAAKSYWPIQRCDETVENFVEAFSTIGYVPCDNGNLVDGYEKVALYTLNDVPVHMAYQGCDGTWTSKLGAEWDIIHASEHGLAGDTYGTVSCYMSRARA